MGTSFKQTVFSGKEGHAVHATDSRAGNPGGENGIAEGDGVLIARNPSPVAMAFPNTTYQASSCHPPRTTSIESK